MYLKSKAVIWWLQMPRHPQIGLFTAFLSHFWPTGWMDDWSLDFRFLDKQFDAPSIGMLLVILYIYNSVLYWINSLVHDFYICFDFEPHIGHQNMLHSVYCLFYVTGCWVKLEAKTETKCRWFLDVISGTNLHSVAHSKIGHKTDETMLNINSEEKPYNN